MVPPWARGQCPILATVRTAGPNERGPQNARRAGKGRRVERLRHEKSRLDDRVITEIVLTRVSPPPNTLYH